MYSPPETLDHYFDETINYNIFQFPKEDTVCLKGDVTSLSDVLAVEHRSNNFSMNLLFLPPVAWHCAPEDFLLVRLMMGPAAYLIL